MSPGFLQRIGLAIVRPRAALAVAGDRDHAGRSGSDLLLVILLVMAATSLRQLVGAAWLGAVVGPAFGFRAAVQVLTDSLTVDLGFLLIAALVIYAASGTRRDLGRSFDLACVVALPLLLVELAVTVFLHAAHLKLGHSSPWLVVALAWAGSLLALAAADARSRRATDPGSARVARAAGAGVLAVAAIGLVLEGVWIAQNADAMRPMTAGDRAPAFSLPAIGAKGALGEMVTLPAGRPVVLDFWATWCKPCLQALPHLDELATKHPELAVIAVNIDDPAEARALFDARGYHLTLVMDDQQTSARYGVSTIPHTVVIDRDGHVQRVLRGGGYDLEAEVGHVVK